MRARWVADRGSVFVIREPWRARRVCFSFDQDEFFEGGGSKKTAGLVKAGANARFHTSNVLQNSFITQAREGVPP